LVWLIVIWLLVYGLEILLLAWLGIKCLGNCIRAPSLLSLDKVNHRKYPLGNLLILLQ